MIVRIAGEGQYELADDLYDELNELDNRTVEAVDTDDEALFGSTFGALLEFVRARGTPLHGDDLRESQVILPPSDLTLDEAEHEFSGEGILPDAPG